MKSLMLLLQCVLSEEGTRCCTSTARDYQTITGRVKDEGLSFLTITLANFGKDFEKSLDQGFVASDLFNGFRFRGGLPAFLRGFLSRVFDTRSGRLLDDPSIDCIRAIRQITLMFAKINLPCTEVRERKAMLAYVQCEQEIKAREGQLSPELETAFHRAATLLWSEPLSIVDRKVYERSLVPNHSRGSTADSITGNRKWDHLEWTERLDRVFPIGDYLLPSFRFYKRLSSVNLLEPGAERPVKVISVPKTQKTPRIIAMEPTCMQYMQQALKDGITEAVDANDIASTLIGWMSQTPNRVLARRGSLSGDFATLDLSEASDRVSYQHVRLLLRNHPHLLEGVDACRSRKADVPGMTKSIRLSKFASMGSALTFPLESMVFMTIVFVGISLALNRPLSKALINEHLGRVRVYGDDIIIPVEYVQSVTQLLETFGLKVNYGKSFWTGKFRESCGGDYYAGEDVSIVRLRSLFPSSRQDVSELVSLVSLRNQCYFAGLWKTAGWLDGVIGKLIPFPTTGPEAPGLTRHSYLPYQTDRHCPQLHRPLVKAYVVEARLPVDKLDGVGALLKCLTMKQLKTPERESWDSRQVATLPGSNVNHLERSGRPLVVSIKPRWVTPY